ncbi:hypothetical protein KY317_02775 [Candidatus Woesearchaeota archaeon]|nr:hypothetical protein [Candidatus Woesearchaeota archaeon]
MKKLQQGDVILVKIDSIPEGAIKKEKSKKGFVLAEGEVTGHAHVIKQEIEIYERAGNLYVKNINPVEIEHEEHANITLEPSIWEVKRVREKDHFADEVRRVMD